MTRFLAPVEVVAEAVALEAAEAEVVVPAPVEVAGVVVVVACWSGSRGSGATPGSQNPKERVMAKGMATPKATVTGSARAIHR